uniref:Uncharacterized protein n=1 Tax=Oryza barthii TaxID=65489 RepID=A0A0D3HPN4_9ORYZ
MLTGDRRCGGSRRTPGATSARSMGIGASGGRGDEIRGRAGWGWIRMLTGERMRREQENAGATSASRMEIGASGRRGDGSRGGGGQGDGGGGRAALCCRAAAVSALSHVDSTSQPAIFFHLTPLYFHLNPNLQGICQWVGRRVSVGGKKLEGGGRRLTWLPTAASAHIMDLRARGCSAGPNYNYNVIFTCMHEG